jgi:hypothetical protein
MQGLPFPRITQNGDAFGMRDNIDRPSLANQRPTASDVVLVAVGVQNAIHRMTVQYPQKLDRGMRTSRVNQRGANPVAGGPVATTARDIASDVVPDDFAELGYPHHDRHLKRPAHCAAAGNW